MTDTTETARALLYRHNLPEDVIDGALALHAQELAAAIREETRRLKAHGVLEPHKYRPCRDAANQIDPTRDDDVAPDEAASAVVPAADWAALRDRIAEALVDWAYRSTDRKYTALRRDETVRANAYSRADAVLAVLPAPADPATVLTEAERTMLAYALDQAQERIWSEDGFTDEDQAAVTSLRRLTAAGRVAADTPPAEMCGRTRDVSGNEYPPCARQADHPEAYCRSADGNAYFLGAHKPGPAAPAQPGKEAAHVCGNCEGIDPDSCLMNPDRSS